MSNISLKSNGAEIILPSNHPLEISKGSLTLTLSFNNEGGFSLTQSGKPVTATIPTAELTPGAIMPDGTVYAGISPDTGRAFYAAAQDAPKFLNWHVAREYAKESKVHDHKDWRVPTHRELNVLFNNRSAIGSFNTSGSLPACLYWASSEVNNFIAWNQSFIDGENNPGELRHSFKSSDLSVRCVRG